MKKWTTEHETVHDIFLVWWQARDLIHTPNIQIFDNFSVISCCCFVSSSLFMLVVGGVVFVVTRKSRFFDRVEDRGSEQRDKRAHKDVAGALLEPATADCRGCEDHDDGKRDGLVVKGERLAGDDKNILVDGRHAEAEQDARDIAKHVERLCT